MNHEGSPLDMPPGYDERLKAAGIDPGAVAPCDFHRVPAMTLVCERCGVDFTPEALMTDEHTTSVSNDPSDVKPKPLRNLKSCDGKAPLDLLPAGPLRAIASAFHDGATVYEPWDWAEETDGCREMYVAAALRHLLAYADPDDSDYAENSGVHHLAAVGANIMILLYHDGIDYHVPNSVRDVELEPPFYVTAGCECHSAGCPKCQPELKLCRHGRKTGMCPICDGWGPTPGTGGTAAEVDVRAQCPATDVGRQCALGRGHGGPHTNRELLWEDAPAAEQAQCSAHDSSGARCLKDDEHEGVHVNDDRMWDDGACRQGCP